MDGAKIGIIQNAEGWLFKVAAKKIIVKVVSIVVTWLTCGIVAHYATQFGITADPVKLQAELTGLALTGLKGAEDWINLRYGTNF